MQYQRTNNEILLGLRQYIGSELGYYGESLHIGDLGDDATAFDEGAVHAYTKVLEYLYRSGPADISKHAGVANDSKSPHRIWCNCRVDEAVGGPECSCSRDTVGARIVKSLDDFTDMLAEHGLHDAALALALSKCAHKHCEDVPHDIGLKLLEVVRVVSETNKRFEDVRE